MAHSSSSADAAAVGWGGSADAGSVPFRYSDRELERKLRFANGLAFLSGVADVATYSTAGCYASMMTGNTINFMSAVAANRLSDSLFFLAMVVNYVAGISGFRLLSLRKGLPAAALAPCILVLFAAVDGLMLSTASRWPLLLLALCFGYINALSSERTGGGRAGPIGTCCRHPPMRCRRNPPLLLLPPGLLWPRLMTLTMSTTAPPHSPLTTPQASSRAWLPVTFRKSVTSPPTLPPGPSPPRSAAPPSPPPPSSLPSPSASVQAPGCGGPLWSPLPLAPPYAACPLSQRWERPTRRC